MRFWKRNRGRRAATIDMAELFKTAKEKALASVMGPDMFCRGNLLLDLQTGPEFEAGEILMLLENDLIPADNTIPIITAKSDVEVILQEDKEQKVTVDTGLAANVAAGTQGVQAAIGGSHQEKVEFIVRATERKKQSLFKLLSGPAISGAEYDALLCGNDIPRELQHTWKLFDRTYNLHFFLITKVQEAAIRVFSKHDGKTAATASLSAVGLSPFHSSGEKDAHEIVELKEKGNIGYSFRGFTIYVFDGGERVFVSNSTAVSTEDQLGQYIESRKEWLSDGLTVTFRSPQSSAVATVYLNVTALSADEEHTDTLKSIKGKISEQTKADPPEPAHQEVPPQRLHSEEEEVGENQESAQSFFGRNTLFWFAAAVWFGLFVLLAFLARKQYGASLKALCNAIEGLRLQSCGPVPRGGTNDIVVLLPWLAMPTYLKARRCIDQPLSPEQVSAFEESCLDESRLGQAFAVDRFDYFGMGLIALLITFGFLVWFWGPQNSTRTAQAPHQRQSHPRQHGTPLRTQLDGATTQDTDTPGLSASSSLSPAAAGGSGISEQPASGSQYFTNESDEEMGFEDLHWVIQQSSSSGFAVIYHDAEAAHNPRCHLFLQKKDLSTGDVVKHVNVSEALTTVLEILDSASELIDCTRIADKNNHARKHGSPPSVVRSASNLQADSPESNSSGSTNASSTNASGSTSAASTNATGMYSS